MGKGALFLIVCIVYFFSLSESARVRSHATEELLVKLRELAHAKAVRSVFCGDGNVGNGTCPTPGDCCSWDGYCGSTNVFCGHREAVRVNSVPERRGVASKCTKTIPKTFDGQTFLNWAKSDSTYVCAVQYMMAQPELKGVVQSDSKVLPDSAYDILASKNTTLYQYALALKGVSPTSCMRPDSSDDFCNIHEFKSLPSPGQTDFPPLCSRTFCWFKPGAPCTTYEAAWNYIELWKADIINSNPKLASIKAYLKDCSRVNCSENDPINPIMTKCKNRDFFANIKCPLTYCRSAANSRDENIVQTLRSFTDKKKVSLRGSTTGTCSSTFDCYRCQDSNVSSSQACTGESPSKQKLCCTCGTVDSN